MNVHPYYVRPNMPNILEPLRDLANNYWYSWNWQVVQLFIRMDPNLWEESYQNPVAMLTRISQERLEELGSDDSFVANLRRVHEMYTRYQNETTWFDRYRVSETPPVIAYFSCEYGIAEGLPIYSGGLGILSGDHLKSSSDLGIPLVAIGLLYQEGYFRQYLNNDGWQQERYPENDWHTMPVQLQRDASGEPVKVDVAMNGFTVWAQVWRAQVGMTPLYLLDTNIAQNPPEHRAITRRLYGGDRDMRIRQELLLGVGGVRALRSLGMRASAYHMNEGHSAFLALERLRRLMHEQDLSYDEAREHVWATNIFTTHTPVPAGNERFAEDLMRQYLSPMAIDLGLEWKDFMALGRVDPNNAQEDFCMTVLALKLSALNNGVAKLHGVVSRNMWHDLWPDLPVNEVPIKSVTNGIHTLTWISHDLRELLVTYLGPNLVEQPSDASIWERVDRIPDTEFWRVHQLRRERLVFLARSRLRAQVERHGASREAVERATSVLNPQALTLGFARRFATYKRGDLLFSDPDRLERILCDPDRPVQIVFAGKAHPQDAPGKEMIKRIVHFAREERFREHIVFVEDYDINIGRYLVQGCDVWINTPRRPLEASGTSGMKAAANGVLNLSVMDGWWDEAYGPDTLMTGWPIGGGEEYDDARHQDYVEGQALYDVLEREVIPLFYSRNAAGLPREWILRSKACMRQLAPQFSSHRMLMDYATGMYCPAIDAHEKLEAGNFALTRELAGWRHRVDQAWGNVAIIATRIALSPGSQRGDGAANRLLSGEKLVIEIEARLGDLTRDDVQVEVYHGRLDARDEIIGGTSDIAIHVAEQNGIHRFHATIACVECGRLGFAARITPRHEDIHHPFMSNTIVWDKENRS